MISWYRSLLISAPLRTNAVTAGLLGAAGDALAQGCEYVLDIMSPGKSGYNWPRTVNMAVFGLVAGPLYSAWYRGLDHAVKTCVVNYEVQIFSKVITDNVLAAPLMLHLYYGLTGLLEGRSPAECLENARSSFYKAWGLGLPIWFPVQFFNFHLVGVPFQAITVAFVDTGWKMSLSLLNHRAAYGKHPEEDGPIIKLFTGEGPKLDKAAPALHFSWPSPTTKLEGAQLRMAEQQLEIECLQQQLADQNRQLTGLNQQERPN